MSNQLQAVWKVGVLRSHRQSVSLPAGAEILSIQAVGLHLQLWALVDPTAEIQTRWVECVVGSEFLGTLSDGVTREHIASIYAETNFEDYETLHFFELKGVEV